MTIDVVNLYRSIWATARLTVALWTASGEEPSKQTLSSFFLARLTCTCKLTFFALYGSALQCSLRREFRPLFSSGTTCVCLGFSSFCLSRKFCPRMRHYRTALFSSRGRAASTSLDLILVFPSIPPHLFSDLCLVTEQTAKFCSNQNLCTHPTTNQPAYSVGSGCEKLRSIAKLRLLMVGNLVQGNF